MKAALLILAVSLCACAQQPKVIGPFTVSGNYPVDLFGPVDTRNLTWGHADSATLPITFKPPAGYRVRILRLRGDLTAMPRLMEGQASIPSNRYVGVLLGFSAASSAGSQECDFCAAGCFVYVQDVLRGGEAKRAPFDYDFHKERTLLDADAPVLNLKLAAYLNTTEYPEHLEGTYTITFSYVKQ